MDFLVAVLLLITLGLSICALWRPGIAVALVWSLYATEQLFQAHFSFFLEHGSFLNIGIALVVLASILFGARSGAEMVRLNQVAMAFALFVVFAVCSCFWAVDPNDSLRRMKEAIPYFVIIGFAAPLCIRRPMDLRDAFLTTVVFGGLVMLAIGLRSGGGLGIAIETGRGQRLQGNYLAIGEYAMIVGLVSISVLIIERDPKFKLVSIVATSAALLALYRSGARGQAIAFMIGAISIYYGLHRYVLQKPMSRSITAIVLSAAIALLIMSQFEDQLGSQRRRWELSSLMESNASSSGLMVRLEMAGELLKAFAARPSAIVLGLGSSSSFELIGFYCHNVPVEVLCELGIVGAYLYFSLLFRIHKIAWNSIADLRESLPLRFSQIVLFSICLSMFVLQFKQGAVTSLPSFIGLATLIATANELPRGRARPSGRFRHNVSKVPVS